MTRNEFNVMLEKFDCEPRLARNCDVLAYWEGKNTFILSSFKFRKWSWGSQLLKLASKDPFLI
jgi:hypothetical protein